MSGWIFFFRFLVLFWVSESTFAECKGGDGVVSRDFDMGVQYVPRDAPIGSVIGKANVNYTYVYNTALKCVSGDTWEVGDNHWPLVTGVAVAPFETGVGSAKIIKTNIPGVGLVISAPKYLNLYGEVVSGVPPYVPYIQRVRVPGSIIIPRSEFNFTLIKIGENIPLGSSAIVNPTAAVYVNSGAARLLGVYLKGTVIRSECSVAGAGNAYLEVPMGDIMRRKFNGKYTTLDSKDFSIPLTNCVAGSYPTGQGWNYYQNSRAHIKFEGVQGSSIIDAGKGILGLTQASTAKGVGIQILRKDGVTPLTLGQDVSIAKLNGTSMNIELKARYIQTSDTPSGPEPGKANARAAFTVTYK